MTSLLKVKDTLTSFTSYIQSMSCSNSKFLPTLRLSTRGRTSKFIKILFLRKGLRWWLFSIEKITMLNRFSPCSPNQKQIKSIMTTFKAASWKPLSPLKTQLLCIWSTNLTIVSTGQEIMFSSGMFSTTKIKFIWLIKAYKTLITLPFSPLSEDNFAMSTESLKKKMWLN